MSLLEEVGAERLKQALAKATPEQRALILPALEAELEARKYDWRLRARPEQLPPDWLWMVWLILAGRGYGKTRTGAEWAKEKLVSGQVRLAVVAPTSADARDTCIEGESGLLSVLPPEAVKTWNRSLGELILVNGSRAKCFSGDEPDRLRGPQHHFAWVDELAAFRYPEAWDQLMFGLRLGDHPQVVATTTPRPTKLIRELTSREDVAVTRGSTFDNAANLAPSALEQLRVRYEGTRLGRQELFAEVLLDNPGALWTWEVLEANRQSFVLPTKPGDNRENLAHIVVGVDPSGGDDPENDEQGIVVAGVGYDDHGYVVDDRSCRLTPAGWGDRAVMAYVDWHADWIAVEDNYGGAMAESTIETAAEKLGVRVKIKRIHASRGKRLRAEPVSSLYEQGRIHHLGVFSELETQMTEWVPFDKTAKSPDRVDALVFAITELMVDPVPVATTSNYKDTRSRSR